MCKMHRAYQPVLPCGNKFLQLKWDEAKYEEHKKRIQAAKPLVDTSAPAVYNHLHLKLGKLKDKNGLQLDLIQISLESMEKLPFDPKPTHGNGKTPIDFRGAWMSPCICTGFIRTILDSGKKSMRDMKLEEDRRSAVERDNRLLLKKMSCIMRTKGRIDNKNDYKAKSLNGEKRRQELRRVKQENRAILDRIAKSQPQYRVQRWQEDWQRAEKYMASIARYPRGWCKAQSPKEERFNKKKPKQDRNREKQLKEGVKSKRKEKES